MSVLYTTTKPTKDLRHLLNDRNIVKKILTDKTGKLEINNNVKIIHVIQSQYK